MMILDSSIAMVHLPAEASVNQSYYVTKEKS